MAYKLESQIETNAFVNNDYETMSNSVVRYYTGPHPPDSKLEDEQETDEEFLKWLL